MSNRPEKMSSKKVLHTKTHEEEEDTSQKSTLHSRGPLPLSACMRTTLKQSHCVSAAQPVLMFHQSMHVRATGLQAVHARTD